jgi:hypothetical protein
MKGAGKTILIGVVTWATCQLILLVVGALSNLLPVFSISDAASLMPYLFTFTISVLFTIVVLVVLGRRKRVYNSNFPLVFGSRIPPMFKHCSYKTSQFEVDWEVDIGSGGLTYGEEEAYARGPFCPKDHYQLDSVVESTFFGTPRSIWRCGSCGTSYPRDKYQYRREYRVVEKRVLADHQTGNVTREEDG